MCLVVLIVDLSKTHNQNQNVRTKKDASLKIARLEHSLIVFHTYISVMYFKKR